MALLTHDSVHIVPFKLCLNARVIALQEEIKEFLDQACSFFPEESRQKCVNMVNTYLDIIVSLLIQQTTPTQLCQIVGFCPNCKFGFSSYRGSLCPNWSKLSGASVEEGA